MKLNQYSILLFSYFYVKFKLYYSLRALQLVCRFCSTGGENVLELCRTGELFKTCTINVGGHNLTVRVFHSTSFAS